MKTKANGEKRLIKAPFYPLPTYRALIYAAVLFGFLTFAALRRNVPMRVAAAMLVVLPIISVLYGFICFCGISASFGFDIPAGGDVCTMRPDGTQHWTITKVMPLYEVSPCVFPAYQATHIEAREQQRDAMMRREFEARKMRLREMLKGGRTNA